MMVERERSELQQAEIQEEVALAREGESSGGVATPSIDRVDITKPQTPLPRSSARRSGLESGDVAVQLEARTACERDLRSLMSTSTTPITSCHLLW